MTDSPPKLRGISDLREFFRTNTEPIYFVSPTAFNLLGIDRWVRNFHYVCYYDSFEGSHPSVFVPADRQAPEFESIEDICNFLLSHREVTTWMRSQGEGGRVVFVMFDEETERLAIAALDSIAQEVGRDNGSLNRGKHSRDGLDRGASLWLAGVKPREHERVKPKLAQEWVRGKRARST